MVKNEYDEYGNKTYHVNSDGYWYKNEYDSNGNVVYFENSLGEIIDKRNNNNLNESVGSDHYYDKLLNILQPPYFQNLRTIGISEDKYESIFSKLFDHPVKIVMGDVYNSVEHLENGNEIYYENSDGFWTKYEYDENENEIYSEDSNGNWEKYEYDENGNEIYYEKSDGYWFKKEYNENGQITYIENSNGVVIDYGNNGNLNESVGSDHYYDKIVNILEVPYYQNLETIGIPKKQWEDIFSKLFNQPVYIDLSGNIRNGNGNVIYRETSDGTWEKFEYDEKTQITYYENSYGYWRKYEYDSNGNVIYYENDDGVVFDRRNNNLNESVDERYYDKIVNILEVPYYQNLETIGIDEDKWEIILSKVFNQTVEKFSENLYDPNDNLIYHENSDGQWSLYDFNENGQTTYFENSEGNWKKFEFDDKGYEIYRETSDGYWSKNEYDSNGNIVYYETSDGYWYKKEYDENGNQIYIEDSTGMWSKYEYDEYGNRIYHENTNGVVFDHRNINLNESVDDRYYDKIVNLLEVPYFKNLETIGISEEQYESIFSKLFNQPVYIDLSGYIRNGMII